MFLYASLVFPVCIAVILILILQLVGIVGVSYNLYLIPSLLFGLAVFSIIVCMAVTALSLNHSFAVHRDLLLEKLIKIKQDSACNIDAIKNIAYVIEKLKHDILVRPIKIIGITIDDSFILKVIILSISGLFAIIELVVRK